MRVPAAVESAIGFIQPAFDERRAGFCRNERIAQRRPQDATFIRQCALLSEDTGVLVEMLGQRGDKERIDVSIHATLFAQYFEPDEVRFVSVAPAELLNHASFFIASVSRPRQGFTFDTA